MCEDFTSGSESKDSACNAGDPGLIPGSRRSPREGNGNPLQYSCLESSMDREAWQASLWDRKEPDTIERPHFHFPCVTPTQSRCTMLSCFSHTLCDPVSCSPPGSPAHGILQARILEWVAVPSSRRSSWSRHWTCISYVLCIGMRVLYH